MAAAQAPPSFNWLSHEQALGSGRALDKPVMLYFSAPWCYLCRKMGRLVFTDPKVAALMRRDFILVRVDISVEEEVKQRYAINQVPTTIFLDRQGRQVLRLTGYQDRSHLTRALGFVASGAYRTQDWDTFRDKP